MKRPKSVVNLLRMFTVEELGLPQSVVWVILNCCIMFLLRMYFPIASEGIKCKYGQIVLSYIYINIEKPYGG